MTTVETCRTFALTLLLGLLLAPLGYCVKAQTENGTTLDLLNRVERQDLSSTTQQPGIALESIINPDEYYVGPSDVFSVNIWISPPTSYLLTVSPEGTLIIPTIGEVRVADLKLSEVKKIVRKKIGNRYKGGQEEPSVTLVTPRPIVVWVRGNVLNPGSFELRAFNRADKAIDEANRIQSLQTQDELTRILSTMSTRHVTVRHNDGTSSPVDISKFLATKKGHWNPYLREGDVVIVPRKDLERSAIGIYGEVNVPGRVEYVRGDSIRDILGISQGFTSKAIVDSLEFFRFDPKRDSMVSTIFDGRALLAREIPDHALEPGDRIVVRAHPDSRADFTVNVIGEVVFPGVYPISRDKTYLREVIRKAGGFTEFASIKTSELVRQSVLEEEVELERLLSQRGGASADDSLYYYLETDLKLKKEIVNVDFSHVFVEGDTTQDVLLKSGDEVLVPTKQVTIYVFGQVASPGHIPFLPGGEVEFYIRQAGGYTDRARPDDIRIVKAKTRQWIDPDNTTVEEGDYIWVPKEVERPFGYYMAIIGQSAAILSVALSIILITLQIGNQ